MSEVCQMRFLKAHIHTKKSVIIICFLRQSVFEVPAKEKLNCFGWWQVLLLLLPYLLFMKSILQFPYSSVPNSHLGCKVASQLVLPLFICSSTMTQRWRIRKQIIINASIHCRQKWKTIIQHSAMKMRGKWCNEKYLWEGGQKYFCSVNKLQSGIN